MNIRNLGILAVTACQLFVGRAQAQNYQLVWSDEFNGSIGPDWVFETGTGNGGWGNNELQYYRRENATIENNALCITARREAFAGSNYTSARMKTQGKRSWRYGKIEARIAMPATQGIWPAFWMLGDKITQTGWPACGEIDIMEHINTGGQVFGTIHWSDQNNIYAQFPGYSNTDVVNYQNYTVEWDANAIRWYINGNKYHEANIAGGVNGTSEFSENFFMLFNMAVGGNFPGNNIDNNAFPLKMRVDWVRVYQLGNNPPPPPPPAAGNSQFLIVNENSGKSIDLIGGNTANGALINQYAYDYNGPNQRWSLQPTEGGNHFKIISAVSGKSACPVADSLADGVQIHAYDYTGNNPSQQWDLLDRGNGYFSIRNVRSGKFLDIANSSTADNAKLQQVTDYNTSAQHFRLQPWGNYSIKTSANRYLAVANSGSANGSQVIQYDYQNNPWFKWNFSGVGGGYLRASSLNALGRVICPIGGSTALGQGTHIYDYNGANVGDQKLRILPKTNGKFKFYFVNTNYSWDIPGGQTGNNVPLQQYSDNGNAQQEFSLERQ